MHILVLGESQVHVFAADYAEMERKAYRQRQIAEGVKAAKMEAKKERTDARGFIPRLAGALGLF